MLPGHGVDGRWAVAHFEHDAADVPVVEGIGVGDAEPGTEPAS
jgi:hypothetical protein